jgi:Pyruvate/2-oxoacid:ferredoxin oxidoreductase gamma subunit
MSVNESKEFEAINQKCNERKHVEESQEQAKVVYVNVKKAKARKKGLRIVAVVTLLLAAAVGGIIGLEAIGWINQTFSIVLMAIAGAVSFFKIGCAWNEIKN